MQAFGGIFTLVTSIMVFADSKWGGTSYTSEQVGHTPCAVPMC
jgi:hypothetical protein